LRIAVEARYLLSKETTGVENYTYFLLSALARAEGDHELQLYVHRRPRPEELKYLAPFLTSSRAQFHVVPPLKLWLKLWMPLAAQLHGAEVGLFPGGILPRYRPFPSVMVVYDLSWIFYPEFYPPRELDFYRNIFPRCISAAKQIFVISKSTQQDLARLYGESAGKIRLVPCGIDESFAPVQNASAQVREHWGLPPGFILAVGTAHPRKNISALLRAYALLSAESRPPLVLIGPSGDTVAPLRALSEELGIASQLRWLGYIASEQMPLLYSAAGIFVMPSLYEGFGMPVLEAMACGTPVICSNSSALPEVAGDAALLVDPQRPEMIAEALQKIYADDRLAG
jgi:glycosyltransferase involved in cell wall biosynthesis